MGAAWLSCTALLSHGAAHARRPGGAVCTSSGWCWLRPAPQGQTLRAVWGSSSRDVWAVGDGGTALHFDGRRWKAVSTGVSWRLHGLWGASTRAIWAVGERGIIHWNGKRWAPQGPQRRLLAVWGRSRRHVWAVGTGGALLRFDGRSWKVLQSGTRGTLRAVHGRRGTVWVGGYETVRSRSVPLLLRGTRGGRRWQRVQHPYRGTGFNGLWLDAAGDLWALRGGSPGIHVRRRAGGRWFSLPRPSTGYLTAVGGHPRHSPWLLGAEGLARWSGSNWKHLARRKTSQPQLRAMWSAGPRDLWVVGDSGLIARWNGARLQQPSKPPAPVSVQAFSTSARGGLWAVGRGGALRLSGNGFAHYPVPAGYQLAGIWAASATSAWAIANMVKGCGFSSGNAAIFRFDGKRFRRVKGLGGYALGGIWGSSPRDVWVTGSVDRFPPKRGGDKALLLHYDGRRWKRVKAPTRAPLADVWGSSARDVWVLGRHLHRYDGRRWRKIAVPKTSRPRRLWGRSASDVWLVGNGREWEAILHWDGRALKPTPFKRGRAGRMMSLVAVRGRSASDVWAVGTRGELLHWDGRAWAARPSALGGLTALGYDGHRFWLAGYRGALLYHR